MTAPNIMSLSRAPWGLGWRLAGRMNPRANEPPDFATTYGAPSAPPAIIGRPVPDVQLPPSAALPQEDANTLPRLPWTTALGSAIRGVGAALNPRGGGVESFLSGLSSSYGATADAMEQARLAPLLFQQAQEDRALEARLKGAQADYYERGARGGQATPYHFESIPGLGILRSNEMTGESGLVGPQGGAPYVVPIPGVETARTRTTIMPPKPPHQFAPQFKVGDDGYQYEYNQRTRRWVQSLGADGRPFKPHMGGGGSSGTVGAGLTPRGGATTKPTAEARFNQLANDPANASKTDDELAAMVRAEIQQGKVQPETP